MSGSQRFFPPHGRVQPRGDVGGGKGLRQLRGQSGRKGVGIGVRLCTRVPPRFMRFPLRCRLRQKNTAFCRF